MTTAPDRAALMERIRSKVAVDPATGCWLWTGEVAPGAHPRLRLLGRLLTARQAVVLVWYGEAALGPPGASLCGCTCGNRLCVAPAHVTVRRATRRQRQARGAGHWNSRLTAEQVLTMRKLRKVGAKLTDLATEFGISTADASRICRGLSWTHVEMP